MQNKIDDIAKERDGAMEVAKTFMGRVLENQIRVAAASVTGFRPEAMDDALLHADRIFTLDDEGNAVQMDADGKTPIMGKDGKTPFSPKEWLEGRREKSAHWFVAGNSGGGASGAGAAAGAKTLTRSQFEGLGAVDRVAKLKEGYSVVD